MKEEINEDKNEIRMKSSDFPFGTILFAKGLEQQDEPSRIGGLNTVPFKEIN